MSGVLLTRHGGPEVLRWSDAIPTPVPGPGEALVQVLAAGVNATDINTRTGWYASGDDAQAGGWAGSIAFPRIQGSDLCGRVVAHGAGVTAPAIGARVICPTNQAEPTADNPLAFRAIGSEFDGAFAGYCTVPARHLFDVTVSPLTDTELGAMPCAYGTALNLLTRAGVAHGDRVLVTGASGGVGLAAVQLALLRGALVTGQCSSDKAEVVRTIGAATIGRDDTPEPRSFDAVIDVVGGPLWNRRIRSLRPGGHYAVSGAIAGPMVEADLRVIYLNDLTLFGCTHQSREMFAELVALINAGALRPLVGQTYPLSGIARAQADFVSGAWPGKLVLLPQEAQP